jgi:hypothetical protein
MQGKHSNYEIVEVFSECRLRDAQSREQLYWRRDGTSLAPGFYVVNWPAGADGRRFHEESLFHGPFRHHQAAEAALKKLKAAAAAGQIDEATTGRATIPEPGCSGNHLTTERRPS